MLNENNGEAQKGKRRKRADAEDEENDFFQSKILKGVMAKRRGAKGKINLDFDVSSRRKWQCSSQRDRKVVGSICILFVKQDS